MSLTAVVATLLFTSHVFGSNDHWTDTDSWSKFDSCNGSNQSPINLNQATAQPMNFPLILIDNYNTGSEQFNLINNGHTAVLKFHKGSSISNVGVPYIKDGGLENQFNFAQLQFHWGNSSDRGSEHTLQNKSYPAEIHFIHYNKKYGSFENATGPNGLAVLGVFLRVDPRDNKALEPITDALVNITKEGSNLSLSCFVLQDLLPVSKSNFYRYNGSLTTPGCNETVVWTVFESPITISENQLNKFRQLMRRDGSLVNNYRPVQPLNNRTVYFRSSASSAVLSLAALIMPVIFWLVQ